MKRNRAIQWLACTALVAGACGDDTPAADVVARAGAYTLTVDEATRLLVDQENLPNQTQVVEALADLWIDYTLLADAVARDTTLRFLDLDGLVQGQVDQMMIFQLRDSVIQVDTAVSDEDLRTLYSMEAPGARVRARHVLLGFPQGATGEQRDSVRARAEALRQRVMAGESFAQVARQSSQDAVTAAQGGDLGWFGRGEMVRPVDEAVFALEPGEVSDVVESPFGYHVIRLDSLEVPGFEQVRDQYRNRVRNRRYLSAESLFVAGVEERAAPEIVDGAYDVMRTLAGQPGQQLGGRAQGRALARYQGGIFTAAEFQAFVQGWQPQERQRVVDGTDEQLENFVRGLVQRKLLVREARNAGLAPTPTRLDSMTTEVRSGLRDAARQIGVLELDRAPGEAAAPAVKRAVNAALADILSGGADVLPLGRLAFQLREGKATSINEAGVGSVVLQVGRERVGRTASPLEEAVPNDSAAPITPPSN